MNVGKRIKYARDLRNKTLLEVAEFLGVSEATVQRYESGNIKNLKLDTITDIAKFLKINPAYLMGWTYFEEDLQSQNEYSYYPTVYVSAGELEAAETVAEYDVEKIKIPDALLGKWAGHSDLKIMRINGDSMNNVIPNKSIIAVKPVEFSNLKDGEIVVFNKEYEYSTKRFFNDKSNQRFIFKPDSADLSFTDHIIPYEEADDLIIEGRVVLYNVELN